MLWILWNDMIQIKLIIANRCIKFVSDFIHLYYSL